MKIFLKTLFVLFIIGILTGIYLNITGNELYHIVFGISILFFAFIFMPVFIFYRYKKGKYKKYVIDPNSKNPFKINQKDLHDETLK